MTPKIPKKIRAEVAARIVHKMLDEGWTDEEVGRFLDLWWRGGGTRLDTMLEWVSEPEDELDTRVDKFLRAFFQI